MQIFPGLKVVMPSTAADAKGLLKSAIRDDNPVMFLEQERMYGLKGEVPEDDDFTIPLGVADIKREGTDCTIVARSMTVPMALQAAEQIQTEFDVSVEVIDPRTIKPLDIDTIVNSVKKTNRLVIAEESHSFASSEPRSRIQIMEHAFDYLDAPVKRISMCRDSDAVREESRSTGFAGCCKDRRSGEGSLLFVMDYRIKDGKTRIQTVSSADGCVSDQEHGEREGICRFEHEYSGQDQPA